MDMTTMDNITDEERKVVDELRRRTIHEMTPKMLADSSISYRFAKARDFNLVEAEAMLRKHISWRKEYQIDTILMDYEPPKVLLKYGATSFVCFDKEGSVVRVQDWGRGDAKGLSNCVSKTEMAKYWFYLGEQDKAAMLKRVGNITKPIFCEIYDLDELTYANAVHVKSLQYLVFGVKMLLDNYPESVKNISIINAPFYFPWTYAVLKPVLPLTVTQKIRVYGTEGWKEVLLKNIDADDLPTYLGGNKTDPDGNPYCETIIQRGKPVPKSYYKQKGGKSLLHLSDAEKVTVMPFSKEEINFEIKEENSYFEWEIEVKNRDIDFSLKYRGESSENLESEEVIPKQRMDSSESEKGCFKCEKIGFYTILFDNSYSWLHSKEVYYKVRIRNMKNNDLHDST